MEKQQIALITVCRNRLHHLRQTLPQNIRDNADCPDVYFLVLDYNSSDGLTDWIQTEMQSHLQSGILRFYRTGEPEYYHHARSRNMAFQLADADLLCNLDADNYTGMGFANYLRNRFTENRNRILVTFGNPNKKVSPDVYGRICLTRSDFVRVNGYDENIELYGGVDIDLAQRVAALGREKLMMEEDRFLHCIKHSDTERLAEMNLYRNLYACYVAAANNQLNYLLLLFRDQSFELVTACGPGAETGLSENMLDEGNFLWDEYQLKLTFSQGYNWDLQGRSTDQLLESLSSGMLWFKVESYEGLATWAVQYMYIKTNTLIKAKKTINSSHAGQGN